MLEIFKYDNKNVRTIEKNGNPWFVAKDLCDVLEVKNTTDALNRLDEDEKMTLDLTESHSGTRGGAQSCNIVNESGMYSLVLCSRKPGAKAFKKWITSEVIPSIRKTGSYGLPKVSNAELTYRLAEQNLMLHNRVDVVENKVDDIENKFEALSASVKAIAYTPTSAPKEAKKSVVKSKSKYVSIKEYGLSKGVKVEDGVSQGIGRSASKICRTKGIKIQKRPSGPNATTMIKCYPETILEPLFARKGL